jgi:DNA-binding response OmpR family regulator
MDDIKKKILIVEDDNHLQMIYKTKLESDGYEIIQATTGQQGITLAKDKHPDLILLDIMLPEGMNGFDVMGQLQIDANTKDIPIIVFTNLDSEKQTAISMGAVDYVVKANTSIDELTIKVKNHIYN